MCALFYCLPPLSLLSVRGSEEEGIPDVCTLAGPSPSSFSCTPAPLPRSLSLAIVEEHHEVLPYWEACLKRVHPSRDGDGEGDGKDTKPVFQKRNTLLHVDVHSDLSLPVSGVPVEPWLDGITPAMMQKPDLHVLAAAYAGVYDRVVWLHPWWTSHKPDKKPSLSRPSMSEHLMQYHFIGYGTKDLVEQILDSNGYRGLSPETVFCGCSTDMVVVRGDGKNRVSVSQLPVGVSDSIWQNFTACNVRLPAVHHGGGVEDVEDLSFLEPHWCNFSRVVRVESLSLETAESVSERNRQKQKCGDPEEGKTCPPVLFSPDEKVILSIDEAFMGVRAGGRGVREWGLHLEAQKQLDETVSAVFCPTTPDAEREMDGFLKSLVKSVRDACGTAVNGDCHLDLQWTRSFLSLPKRRASLLQRMCGDARGRMQRAAENQRKRMEEKKKQQQGEEVEVPPPPKTPCPHSSPLRILRAEMMWLCFPMGASWTVCQ